ncbi:hypothetical protein DPMN_119221 [Dreissena polymorpha]|uniref:Uncharacterized protein n=1 Tax=Dreissena polymorpha TaxID=45954 RepID=A0A9D4GHW6_DREPO|nr:hypothetical protein DPMN_119221 [Dreissena polymorpha]
MQRIQEQSGVFLRKSWKLSEKANGIAKLLGMGSSEVVRKKHTVKQVFSLEECVARAITSNSRIVPKSKLHCVYAAFIFESERKKWVDNGPFQEYTHIENVGETTWFSVHEYNASRNKYEPKCRDAHHLLVNSGAKVCKDSVDNFKKEAWHNVAEQNSDILNKSLVVDLIDKQNNAYALKVFSFEVENEMRKLKFYEEAKFCNIIRSWYEAEDKPGISEIERTNRRLRIKDYLLSGVDFEVFPAFGKYVKGFHKVWFEGILQWIDTTLQLYVTAGSYNQRSVS